jgi:molybdate transport system substrate-binding protein
MGRIVYILVLLLSCADPPAPTRTPITIFAAASLTEALPAVAALWRTSAPDEAVATTFSFDATPRLAAQITAGAPADVFVSADTEWMDDLAGRNAVDPATRVNLAGNELVLVVPARLAGATWADPPALGASPPQRLALAGETVPAGRYTDAALRSLGLIDALGPHIVRGDSVRNALAYVARAEADAAIVYASDAHAEPRVRRAFAFPATSHPPIVYPAAVVPHPGPDAAARAASARAFLAFCRQPAARAVLLEHGFTPVAD